MTRLCVVCEGQTESEFVNSCLWPYLSRQGIEVYPSTLKTRPGRQGEGMSRYSGSPGTSETSIRIRTTLPPWLIITVSNKEVTER